MLKTKSRGYRPANVGYAQVRRLMWLRYPYGQISNDMLGRDRLRCLIDHLIQKTDDLREILGVANQWCPPSISHDEVSLLVSRALSARQYWGPFETGNLFALTVEERAEHKITVAWPWGFTPEDALAHRRQRKALYERKRRQLKAAEERAASRAAHDDPSLGDREKAVYCELTSIDFTSSSKIVVELSTWAAFKRLSNDALRQLVHRALKKLKKRGLVECEIREGERRQKIVFARRVMEAPVNVNWRAPPGWKKLTRRPVTSR